MVKSTILFYKSTCICILVPMLKHFFNFLKFFFLNDGEELKTKSNQPEHSLDLNAVPRTCRSHGTSHLYFLQ